MWGRVASDFDDNESSSTLGESRVSATRIPQYSVGGVHVDHLRVRRAGDCEQCVSRIPYHAHDECCTVRAHRRTRTAQVVGCECARRWFGVEKLFVSVTTFLLVRHWPTCSVHCRSYHWSSTGLSSSADHQCRVVAVE
jgi:hypothetical protein